MGNNLCKERIERASDSKSPVDRILGRCAQICPSAAQRNRTKNDWNPTKHVFETCAPRSTQPKGTANVWRSATLSVPSSTGDDSYKIEVMPIAPPRKKRRSSSLSLKPIPNGFKDVFGSEDFRRMSRGDSIVPQEKLDSKNYNVIKVRTRSLSSSNSDFTNFSKNQIDHGNEMSHGLNRPNVSRFGDKKSDKFFGENLSDCLSDEKLQAIESAKLHQINVGKENASVVQAPAPVDELDAFQKLQEEKEKSASLDRKAEFLMAMLSSENGNNDEYKGLEPVEEPIVVVKKRSTRCVCCDDDATLRKHLNRHEQEVDDANRNTVSPPRKPSRDLEKYRKSLDLSDENHIESQIQAATIEPPQRNREKRPLSREQLPSPPPRPKKSGDSYESLASIGKQKPRPPPIPVDSSHAKQMSQAEHITSETVEKEPKTIPRNISMPSTAIFEDGQFDTFIKKCNSSNSFLTPEMMDEIMKKTQDGYGMIDHDYWGDIHHDKHDGSAGVAPLSKLENRKISVPKMSTSVEKRPDVPEEHLSFTIGPQAIEVKTTAQRNTSATNDVVAPIISEPTKSKPAESFQTQTIKEEAIVEQPRRKVSKPQPKQISTIDENSINNILGSNEINIESLTHVLDDIYKSNQLVLDDFQNYLEQNLDPVKPVAAAKTPELLPVVEIKAPPIIPQDVEIKIDLADDRHSTSSKNGYHSDSENDEDSERDLSTIVNKRLKAMKEDQRRGSINEMDDWFAQSSNPLQGLDSKSNSNSRINSRRGSECLNPPPRRDRRESIDDVDNWFSKQQTSSPVIDRLSDLKVQSEGNRSRRGSESNVSYDTKKIFPFGNVLQRTRTISESSDFFENRNASINPTISNDSLNTDSRDHSGLLKILQRETAEK